MSETLTFAQMAARIQALKSVETEAAAERALLEAQFVVNYSPVITGASGSVVRDGYKVEITYNTDYKLSDLTKIKEELSDSEFNIFCKVSYEFSKSGYNALLKAAEVMDFNEGGGAVRRITTLYDNNVIKNVRRPTIKVTTL